jgi:uncharacterized protein (TIGR02246 family)
MAKLKFLGLNFLLVVILSVMSLHQAISASTDVSNQTSADEKVLRSQAEEYTKAFANGDAKTIAKMWTADGTYIDPDGVELKGQSEIEKYFASGFKQVGLVPLEISIESIKFPAANVAIEEGTCRVLRGPNSGTRTRYNVVHVKDKYQWLMANVTERDDSSVCSKENLNDFEWLIGNWSAKKPNGSMHLVAHWVGNHKFIHCQYTMKDAKNEKSGEGVQVIGWSPHHQQIVSWHFSPDGGFGFGRWLRDGQYFVESTNGVEPNGTSDSSINTLHKLDDNTFSWHSTGRTAGSESIPDVPEVTVTRDK